MKKKSAIVNFILMLSVVFAVSYQSLHYFSHGHSEGHTKRKSFDSQTKSISDFEHCKICDFHFADFLQVNSISFECYTFIYESNYSFSIQENVIAIYTNLVSLRGPPSLI